jgi:hypothetical protein
MFLESMSWRVACIYLLCMLGLFCRSDINKNSRWTICVFVHVCVRMYLHYWIMSHFLSPSAYMYKDRELGHSSSLVKVQTHFCEMQSLSCDTKGFQIASKVACPFTKSVKFYCLIDLFFIELIGSPVVLR